MSFIQQVIEESIRSYIIEHKKDTDKSYRYSQPAVPHQEVPNFQPKIKPITAYKQFKMRLDKNGNNLAPGYVFPLYINTDGTGTNQGLEIGKWYKSGAGECWLNTKNGKMYTKGKGYGTDGQTIGWLALRSGWHLTNTPFGSQRGANRVVGGKPGTGNNYRNTWDSEVWAKCEICIDIDATNKAKAAGRGSKNPANQYLERIGNDEYYQYKTNANATDDQTWYIVDKIRIVEILDDDTVDSINDTFYNDLSKKTGRKINSDPMNYLKSSNDLPYWKMPRMNGRRYTQQDLQNMGYNK